MGNAKQTMKKIGIYSPYLHILGGGERYIFTIAKCLADKYKVDIFWHDPSIIQKAHAKFNLDLSQISVQPWHGSVFSRAVKLRSCSAFFYMTDGSLFMGPCSKNILIIQSPDKIPHTDNIITNIKLANWQTIVCYSEFMARVIREKAHKAVIPLFVPVDLKSFSGGIKKNYILSVGRFFPYLHSKKYEVLIDAFRAVHKEIPHWELHIAGSVDPGMEQYVAQLKKLAQELPIVFHDDISFTELKKLYSHASLYWHAAGFGENPIEHPERFEHFGVSTVEAMASGCVPLAYRGGGQPEIIQENSGFLWDTKEELMKKTIQLISNKEKIEQYSINAVKRAQNYSEDIFCSKIYEIVER